MTGARGSGFGVRVPPSPESRVPSPSKSCSMNARPDVGAVSRPSSQAWIGKRHGEAGRVEQRARCPAPEAMPGGGVTQLDGVALAAGTKAPAVEHDQDDRGARPTPLCHIGGDAI